MKKVTEFEWLHYKDDKDKVIDRLSECMKIRELKDDYTYLAYVGSVDIYLPLITGMYTPRIKVIQNRDVQADIEDVRFSIVEVVYNGLVEVFEKGTSPVEDFETGEVEEVKLVSNKLAIVRTVNA